MLQIYDFSHISANQKLSSVSDKNIENFHNFANGIETTIYSRFYSPVKNARPFIHIYIAGYYKL